MGKKVALIDVHLLRFSWLQSPWTTVIQSVQGASAHLTFNLRLHDNGQSSLHSGTLAIPN